MAARHRPCSLLPLVVASSAFLTVREARALNEGGGRACHRAGCPAGEDRARGAFRRVTDRDRDGSSPWFGGGDCDDRDARRAPTAVDVPDNGIDEDCSGADLHVPHAAPRPLPPAVAAAPSVVRLRATPPI